MRTLTWMAPAVLAVVVVRPVSAQPIPVTPTSAPAPAPPSAPEAEAAAPTAAENWEAGTVGEESAQTEAEAPSEAAQDAQVPVAAEGGEPPTTTEDVVIVDEQAPAAPPGALERFPGLDALGSHQSHWWFDIGSRTSYVNDSGLDPFGYDDALVQFSVGAGRTLLANRSLSVGIGAIYEVGGKSADARGDTTELLVQRVVLAPEIRDHLWARMYVFARPAFGLLRTRASIDESASGATLEAKNWGTAFDLTAGAAYQILGRPSGEKATPRLWIGADGGYGWGRKVHLEMSPDDDSDGPERIAPLDLGDLTLRGPTFRISVTLSY